jgi:hypothetical protein
MPLTVGARVAARQVAGSSAPSDGGQAAGLLVGEEIVVVGSYEYKNELQALSVAEYARVAQRESELNAYAKQAYAATGADVPVGAIVHGEVHNYLRMQNIAQGRSSRPGGLDLVYGLGRGFKGAALGTFGLVKDGLIGWAFPMAGVGGSGPAFAREAAARNDSRVRSIVSGEALSRLGNSAIQVVDQGLTYDNFVPASEALGGAIFGGALGKATTLGRLGAAETEAVNLGSLTPGQAARIQSFADKYDTTVNVVGSRAKGTAGPQSDFDYILGDDGATSRLRAKARLELPRGTAGGEIHPSRGETGIDVFKAPLDPSRPYIPFKPKAPK